MRFKVYGTLTKAEMYLMNELQTGAFMIPTLGVLIWSVVFLVDVAYFLRNENKNVK